MWNVWVNSWVRWLDLAYVAKRTYLQWWLV